jgi:hypothetical protein
MIELFAKLVRRVEETDFCWCFCNDCDDLQQALACLGTECEPALGGIGRDEPGNQAANRRSSLLPARGRTQPKGADEGGSATAQRIALPPRRVLARVDEQARVEEQHAAVGGGVISVGEVALVALEELLLLALSRRFGLAVPLAVQ